MAKERKVMMLDEVQYKAQQIPGPNKYKINLKSIEAKPKNAIFCAI